ncbi:MAG TPA: NAD-dependent epimerase/dehydratase family protein [Gemmatimonadaceae bacterium]|nr:NAD-dependent epimerase/dehydratase family protein [Gemmatimonadaceae bacterium]
MTALPPRSEEALDDQLSEPRAATVAALARAPGDIVVLGAGGKMGPTLARMAVRALQDGRARLASRVTAVSRFGGRTSGVEESLHEAGVETIRCDLLDRAAVASLPDAANVVFMAGQKFGTREAPSRTWMMNVVVPALCAERYAGSRIVAFSTGNVYPLVPVASGGARETDPVGPVGEYAASCVGRERVFEHYAASKGTRVAIMRLNYAIDLRYGVLTDLAVSIMDAHPIPLTMGHVNVIWQRDANRAALELLPHASSPPLVVNVTGTTALGVRALAERLGHRLGREPRFAGAESGDALLSDTSRMRSLLATPEMDIETAIEWVAEWVRDGRRLLHKPTHFEARDGTF